MLASEAVRYPDPATEFPVLRLTDPSHTSMLPSYFGRPLSRRSSFLLYSNDRTGEFQAYRMDLKTGQSRQLTAAKLLETSSLTLMPDEKSCCYVADGVVSQLNFSSSRVREIYRIADGFEAGSGFSVSEDGLYAFVVERKPGKSRLRLVNIAKGMGTTIVESDEEIADPQPRPRRAGLLYRRGGRELHVVNYDGAQNQKLRTQAGGLGPALWSADGRIVEYLWLPDDRKRLNSIREYAADANEDRLLAPTTQYVQVGRNADSSVFVGSGGSKASPYLLLLVRAVKRELTLCEHKASDPRMVAPIFSPNSQKVFFHTDRHGKQAIYSMGLDRLVEETE